MSAPLHYSRSENEAIRYLIDSKTDDKLIYTIGNVGERTGAEITIEGTTLKLVSNQREGKRLQDRTINISAARGPIVAAYYTEGMGYTAVIIVPSAGESFTVVMHGDDMQRLYETNSISLSPLQKTKLIKNVELVQFFDTRSKTTSVGYDLQVRRGDDDVIGLTGYHRGSDSMALYHRHGRSLTLIDRRGNDSKIHYGFDPEIPSLTLYDQYHNKLVIENGITVQDDISFQSPERSTYRLAGSGDANGVEIALKPSIEGYTVRIWRAGYKTKIAVNTRIGPGSYFGDVFPIKIFDELLKKNGLTYDSFFPEGCRTSPVTFFFNVGNKELVMNSRIHYEDMKNYVMFAFAKQAWEYDTPEAELVDKMFGLGEVRHELTPVHSDMLPKGKFSEAHYNFECNWRGLLFQGNQLHLPFKKSLSLGVIGSRVAVESIGSPEQTDQRLYPGEAVIISIKDYLFRFESPGYKYRADVRDGKPYAFQALFNMFDTPENQVPISMKLLDSLTDLYEASNNPIAILPHYDHPVKMNSVEVSANYIRYCVVMWLFSLPLHSQRSELENKRGFVNLLSTLRFKLEQLAEDIHSTNTIVPTADPKNIEATEAKKRKLFLIEMKKRINKRGGKPSTIDVINSLRQSPPRFGLLYKYYFKHGEDQVKVVEYDELIQLAQPVRRRPQRLPAASVTPVTPEAIAV